MGKKYVMITGANRGLGYESARIFLQNGYYVFFAGRSSVALERARRELDSTGENTAVLELDVNCMEQIDALPNLLEKQGIQLDILINNAGIFPRDGELISGLTDALTTNVIGAVALTLALSEHLLKASKPRVVMVSSGLGSFAKCVGVDAPLVHANYLAYQTSKAALNMATVCIAKQFATTPLIISAISPGWCRTDMGGEDAPRSASQGAEVIYHAATLANESPSGCFLGEDGILPW